MLSWQSKIVNSVVRSTSRFLYLFNHLDINIQRLGFEKFGQFLKVPADIKISTFTINHFSAVWLTAPSNNSSIILYLHGGAYILGSIQTHQALMASIAKKTSCRVLGINYRLAPENPFPAALDDCVMAYQWLLSQNIPAKNIIIAGDSAGGGLAISTLFALKEQNSPQPAAAACLSPWLDLTLQGESFFYNAKNDPLIKKKVGRQIVKLYLNGIDPKFPLASPFYADLSGLPPLFIQTSQSEVLYSEINDFCEKAKKQGVDITFDCWEDMLHGWQLLHPFLPEAAGAIDKMCEFIHDKFAASKTMP